MENLSLTCPIYMLAPTSVNEGTIDEAPMAYKSLDDILDVIGDTVDVIDVMKPVYNFKAAEEKHF